ncbi:MAG: alpha/beta fold hydrolase [Acidobacteriota bacterium]
MNDKRAKPIRIRLRRGLTVLTIGVVGGLLTSYTGFLLLLIWQDTEPAQSPVCCTTPADWGAEYRDVELASHGETLAGWYLPSRNGAAVILLHSGGIHRMGVEREARVLSAEGYGILMYDRRAHGESTGSVNSGGWQDLEDMPAVLDFLRQQSALDFERLGIFGTSMGGQVALRAAAKHPELKAVMVDGPSLCGIRDHLPFSQLSWKYRYWRVLSWLAAPVFELRLGMRQPPSVVDVIANISPRPLLLISTDALETRVVSRYFAFAEQPKTLWQIPEAGHGGGFAARPEEYARRLVRFFDRTLLRSGPRL